MDNSTSGIVSIKNKEIAVAIDLMGGAIIDFHLHDNINPLTFKFSPDQMPQNNKDGAFYQGHFVCMGHWGSPSPGEIKAGLADHGQAANILWHTTQPVNEKEINMEVNSPLDGLRVNRTLRLDDESPVFAVTEHVKNINPLGRLYDIVQHPTIAMPFLTKNTVVNCNAEQGFNYLMSTKPLEHASYWPSGVKEDLGTVNLSVLDNSYNSVFSFIVEKDAEYGWVTAYSPENNLILGYLWKRSDYAWINLWQDFDGNEIRYRGLEFGTSCMHKPFKQIIDEGNHKVFDEETYKYLDAGETHSRSYLAFMSKTPPDFKAAGKVNYYDGEIVIEEKDNKQEITIKTLLKL